MFKKPILAGACTTALMLVAFNANATLVPIGTLTWDVNAGGDSGSFNIANLSGPNAMPAAVFPYPVLTEITLSDLSLQVNFVGGSSETFGPGSGYFTPAAGGSFDGSAIPIGGANPLPESITLTANVSPTSDVAVSGLVNHSGGDLFFLFPSFEVTMSDSGPNLVNGDDVPLYVQTSFTPVAAVPEPEILALLSVGLLGMLLAVREKRKARSQRGDSGFLTAFG